MHVVGNYADVGNKMELPIVVGQIVGSEKEIALFQVVVVGVVDG